MEHCIKNSVVEECMSMWKDVHVVLFTAKKQMIG